MNVKPAAFGKLLKYIQPSLRPLHRQSSLFDPMTKLKRSNILDQFAWDT